LFSACFLPAIAEKIKSADVTKNPPQTNFTLKSGMSLLVKIPNLLPPCRAAGYGHPALP
jgi:hypothetical protein